MRTIPYSASNADLYTPYLRGNYFSGDESRTSAGLCAELSRLAYARKAPSRELDQQQITSVLTRIGFAQCHFFESTNSRGGTHCFTAVGTEPSSGAQVGLVVFRGTDADDPRDIGDDADLLLIPWAPGGRVHRGFAGALQEVEAELGPVVKAMACPVRFTGHSLGAALATLAASLYRPAIAQSSALHTFGSPRVGDAGFTATLAGMSGRRFKDCTDIVTQVPLEAMGYAHVGPPHYINRDGEISFDPPDSVILEDQAEGEIEYLRDYALKPGNVRLRNLADHIPLNYVFAVRAGEQLRAAAKA